VNLRRLDADARRPVSLLMQAHTTGRAVVRTGSREVAELKADPMRTFAEKRGNGVDLGPLGVSVEPAPGG
jgi:ATP-dependent Clp protease adapter protein ClpS